MTTQKIYEEVSVNLVFDSLTKRSYPKSILWKGKLYQIKKIGLHHKYRQGRILYHVFSVITEGSFMRLVFNTDNLHWNLEEVGISDS